MMLNDRLGCCTISAVGHAVQTWTANALGRELTVPDSTILEYYEKWDAMTPPTPPPTRVEWNSMSSMTGGNKDLAVFRWMRMWR